jgi:hypothetical protein
MAAKLKIEKRGMKFEKNSIFSNSSHLEWSAGLSDIILKGARPGTIPGMIGLIWFIIFRGEERQITPNLAAVTKNRNFFNCPFRISQNELKF